MPVVCGIYHRCCSAPDGTGPTRAPGHWPLSHGRHHDHDDHDHWHPMAGPGSPPAVLGTPAGRLGRAAGAGAVVTAVPGPWPGRRPPGRPCRVGPTETARAGRAAGVPLHWHRHGDCAAGSHGAPAPGSSSGRPWPSRIWSPEVTVPLTRPSTMDDLRRLADSEYFKLSEPSCF
jgi:hypothetical protein